MLLLYRLSDWDGQCPPLPRLLFTLYVGGDFALVGAGIVRPITIAKYFINLEKFLRFVCYNRTMEGGGMDGQ